MMNESSVGIEREFGKEEMPDLVEVVRDKLYVQISQGSSESAIREALSKEKSRVSILINTEGVIYISHSNHSDIKNKNEIKGHYDMGSMQFTKGVLTHSWLSRNIDVLLIRYGNVSSSYVGNFARDKELRGVVISRVQDELRRIYPEIYFSPEVVLQDWRNG